MIRGTSTTWEGEWRLFGVAPYLHHQSYTYNTSRTSTSHIWSSYLHWGSLCAIRATNPLIHIQLARRGRFATSCLFIHLPFLIIIIIIVACNQLCFYTFNSLNTYIDTTANIVLVYTRVVGLVSERGLRPHGAQTLSLSTCANLEPNLDSRPQSHLTLSTPRNAPIPSFSLIDYLESTYFHPSSHFTAAMEQAHEQQQQGNPGQQQPQQAFMVPDPSMGGAMPLADPQLMMPLMLANGAARPNGGISAGKPNKHPLPLPGSRQCHETSRADCVSPNKRTLRCMTDRSASGASPRKRRSRAQTSSSSPSKPWPTR